MRHLFTRFSAINNGHDAPWLQGPSICQHILDNIDPETGLLKPEGISLPDEERRYANTRLRWVAGAMDGAFGHHAGANNDTKAAHNVATHIIRVAKSNSQKDKVALYNLLVADNLLDYIDLAISEVAQAGISPYPHLHAFALSLAENAPDRGPVKFAITLLGIIGNQKDKEIVSTLGTHEEFTLYTAVALSNMLTDPERDLWALAQKVQGWGRIHLVERLSKSQSPQIKEWLLREGYRNTIMYEYLAYTCATSGDLRSALSADTIDDELLDATGEIIKALIAGGPTEDIDDYTDAAVVITHYLHLLEAKTSKLDHFVTVGSIQRYLTSDDWDTESRAQNGWSEETRLSAITRADMILGNSAWLTLIQAGLAADNDQLFYLADQAADILGIDTRSVHWARLQNDPLNPHRWFPVMSHSTPENIGTLIDFATRVLPLDQVATGPADELGFGPRFTVHSCLDAIVQRLQEYPSTGWVLIAASLKSPVVRNRNMALRALSTWGQENWTPQITAALIEAQKIEPLTDVRERIQRVLKGAPFDWG